MTAVDIQQALLDSHIHFQMACMPEHINWTLRMRGSMLAGGVADTVEGACWNMAEAAAKRFPDSEFAKQWAKRGTERALHV